MLMMQQRGAVLIISMIILLILTLLGVTSMRSSALQERMAGNTRDKHLAFEAAEAALIDAEDFLSTIATTGAFDTDGSDGLYNDDIRADTIPPGIVITDKGIADRVDWDGSVDPTMSFLTATNIGTGQGLGSAPKYVIQFISSFGTDVDRYNQDNAGQGSGGGKTGLFRITARGTGGSDNSVVVLQTVYAINGL